MKKRGWSLLAVLSLAAVLARAGGPTLVVAPARYSVLQVGFDLVQRCGVTLVSYRGDATTEKPLLHLWTGQEWKYIPLAEFQSGLFMERKPSQTVVIGEARMVPQALAPMSVWAGKQTAITSLFTDEILNQVSKPLRFSREDWAWFAARYNMQLDDKNAAVRNDSFYNHPIAKPIHLQLKRRDRAAKPDVPPAPEPKKDAEEAAPAKAAPKAAA